jgi:hypothetical protein
MQPRGRHGVVCQPMYRRPQSGLRGALLGLGACAVLAAGCAGGSSASSGAATSRPPPSSGGSTGSYVPAAGTAPNGAIFQTYVNSKLGYHLLYPGGWHVSEKAGVVRIAKLGNAIVIATRTAKSAPKVKAVRAALDAQVTSKAIVAVESQPRTETLHGGSALRMVYTKARPATGTAPAATVRVYRYLLFHSGRLVILSMQSPDTIDNAAAYTLIAGSLGWGK